MFFYWSAGVQPLAPRLQPVLPLGPLLSLGPSACVSPGLNDHCTSQEGTARALARSLAPQITLCAEGVQLALCGPEGPVRVGGGRGTEPDSPGPAAESPSAVELNRGPGSWCQALSWLAAGLGGASERVQMPEAVENGDTPELPKALNGPLPTLLLPTPCSGPWVLLPPPPSRLALPAGPRTLRSLTCTGSGDLRGEPSAAGAPRAGAASPSAQLGANAAGG